ncbi:MAG: hypothetical protein GXO78_00805 [Calditrichaeota bacterium]|nr:hypothetical protein [Calditrichota bacterium]
MKRILSLALVFGICFVAWLEAQITTSGYVQTYNRMRLQQNGKYTWNENRLGLVWEGNFSDRVYVYSKVRLRAFGLPVVSQTADLQRREKDRVLPWTLEFREAYVEVYDFLLPNLDLRVGRQRIAWGTGDGLNPTDNLNPDDLEDIFDFGRHFPTNALMMTYYLNDLSLQMVYIPVFTPAILPFGDWAEAFRASMPVPPYLRIRSYQDRVLLPENRLSQTSSFAAKVSGTLFSYDWSLSYYVGRDDLPILTNLTLTPSEVPPAYDVQAELVFPRFRVLGADMAGEIMGVGIWAEAALFFPDRIDGVLRIASPAGTHVQKRQVLKDEPYLKFLIGADYTFKNGWYINGQFLRGFIHERGRDELVDYLLVRLEKRAWNDALKIVPFGIALAIPDWSRYRDNFGFAGGPQISYHPVDALEVSIGAFIIEGKGDNLFSKVKQLDEGFLKVTYSF